MCEIIDRMSSVDSTLRDLLARRHEIDSVPEVVATLMAIQSALPLTDGLRWFNSVYSTVTVAFASELDSPSWRDPAWIRLLDVKFAALYFEALAKGLEQPALAPKCWQPLLASRDRTDVTKIQLALAGMNAHINHDLSIAVFEACRARNIQPTDGSGQHADYLHINAILKTVTDEARSELLAGVPGIDIPDLHAASDIAAIWSVERARDAAWEHAQMMWELRNLPLLRERFRANLDRLTGLAGRGLLAPVTLKLGRAATVR